jgi:hypothetical protein
MTLDELLLEWSYRSEKGYPCLDNPSDISLLKQILEELDLPTDDILDNLSDKPGGDDLTTPGTDGMEDSSVEKEKEKQLQQQPSKLKQVSGNLTKLTQAGIWDNSGIPTKVANVKGKPKELRFDVLVRKIQNNEELTLIDNSTFVVNNKEEALKALNDSNKKSIVFKNNSGEYLYPFNPSQLAKTREFGGQPSAGADIGGKVNTTVKESLVILMCNILKEVDDRNFGPFTSENYTSNLETINNSTTKWQNITDDAKTQIEERLDVYNSVETPPSKVLKILNNPYSIAKEILKTYSNAGFDRGNTFEQIRKDCSKITGLKKDKWNPGDIYLVNSEPTLPTDKDSIVPWNELFVNNWGDKDAPLVSISLKEQDYQPGRAKSYLHQFGVKELYNLSDKELEYNEGDYKDGIKGYRESIEEFLKEEGMGGGFSVKKEGNGWGKFSDNIRILRGKYGAYKLLNFLLDKFNNSSILGLFAFGLSIPGEPSANPTFFKLVGSNSGEGLSKEIEKFPGGSNTDMTEGQPITIEDSLTAANITIRGFIDIIKDGEKVHSKYKVSKTFRGDDKGQIGIV